MALALAAAGCTASAEDSKTPSPFAACAALEGDGPASSTVPDVTLPCFTGDDEVALRSLRGPTVINLWASWCGPCREELPVMQRLADKAGDKLTVVGVDTRDGREAGASFAAAKGVTFPTLFDPDSKLLNAVAQINLPVTIFVDASGKAFVNNLPLDAPRLTTMLREHTGVAVAL
ncbi:TlpA family protein disulfide reductase [Actinoplanes sp. NPDC051513]|uniref:TlpA family protein disulfide reductase n=1 Tax=Actinoplanes sp. NPDC051513 TaxID=3363908 RepID=UPI0037A6C8BA